LSAIATQFPHFFRLSFSLHPRLDPGFIRQIRFPIFIQPNLTNPALAISNFGTMATQSIDPAMAKILGQKYWNHFAIQLGHWNPMKVIIMDDEVFRQMATPVKIELAREMT
jgi:hypothetical protein